MPPVRTMSAIKPMKTERTHEENQERAYIAASRRSDRSLEARVESARRASEIHKRRTGRSLRVTEQDVVNEEMYEEEDDDLPMQYRRLTAHLQTQNAYFDRRVNAYITSQMAMRQAMGQAVADQWQANNPQQNPGQFMNPGLMQMQQQPWFQNQMLPPDTSSRSPQNFRQAPYPLPANNGQAIRHGLHNRSTSAATPQDPSSYQQPSWRQQHSASAQTSPVDNAKMDDRRMSLPAQVTIPQTPQLQGTQQAGSPGHVSPTASRHGSSPSSATPHGYFKQPTASPKQVPTPPQQQQLSMSSPFDQSFNSMMNHYSNPLSSTLPMETQQMLAFNNPSDPMANMFSANHSSMKTQQPFYSYNPNGKPKNTNTSQNAPEGLSQTLAPPSLDTSIGGGFDPSVFMNTPKSAGNDVMPSPFSFGGFGNGQYDPTLGVDALRSSNSAGNSSGQVTPGPYVTDEFGWPDFVNEYSDIAPTAT